MTQFLKNSQLTSIETHKQSIKIEMPGVCLVHKGSSKEIEINREIQKVLSNNDLE